MRQGRTLNLTRRGFGAALSGAAAAFGLGGSSAARGPVAPATSVDPDLRDAMLRGLALAGERGDPVQAAAAEDALARMAATDPEGALLGRIYQLFDARPAAYWDDAAGPAAGSDLALLHGAIRFSRPVAFGYTDLEGNKTARSVLPLALVHPPQGVKLLAWCKNRENFRQFFVRAMEQPSLQAGNFAPRRIVLLQGLLEAPSTQR